MYDSLQSLSIPSIQWLRDSNKLIHSRIPLTHRLRSSVWRLECAL